jgi:hypothetical protein
VSLGHIHELYTAWRAAALTQAAFDPDGTEWAHRDEALRSTRDAYLAAVRQRAARHSYAYGARTVHKDIEHLREAEVRRAGSERGSREYQQAAKDVLARHGRIIIQLIEDQDHADETRAAVLRQVARAPAATGLDAPG